MTLQEFLLKSEGIDLCKSTNSIVSHIRQHVQNIDILAHNEVSELCYEDIRDIFVAIMLDSPSRHAVFHNEAWNRFVEDAFDLNLTENEIETIAKRNKDI